MVEAMQPSSSRAGMTTESSESCGRDGSLMMPEFPIHPDPPPRGDDDIHSFVWSGQSSDTRAVFNQIMASVHRRELKCACNRKMSREAAKMLKPRWRQAGLPSISD
jgi:hypothetical protein